MTVHGRDHRLRRRTRQGSFGAGPSLVLDTACQLLEVRSGAKGAASTTQDSNARLAIPLERAQGVAKRPGRLAVERIFSRPAG